MNDQPYARVFIRHGGKVHHFVGYVQEFSRYLDYESEDLTITWNDEDLSYTITDAVNPPRELDMPNVGEFYD